MVQQVIASQHDAPEAGHLTVRRILERVNNRFYWSSGTRDVISYVESCRLCVKDKATQSKAVQMPKRYEKTFKFELDGSEPARSLD